MCTRKRKEQATARADAASRLMMWKPSLRCNLHTLPPDLFASSIQATPMSLTVKLVDIIDNPLQSGPLAFDIQTAIIYLLNNESFDGFIDFIDQMIRPEFQGILPELIAETEPTDSEAVAVARLRKWHKVARERIECEMVAQYVQTRGTLGDPIWHILQTRFGDKYNEKKQLLQLTQNPLNNNIPANIEFTCVEPTGE